MNNHLYSAEEIHDRLLLIEKEFHNLCVTNNIEYYMLGGTMLGAIRHKGFIPWDDDMDFGVPREDYEKLIRIVSSNPTGDYKIRFYKNSNNSPIHYIKLIDKRTTLIEKEYKNYVEWLYIDVFPLDNDNNSSLYWRLNRKIIHLYHSMIILHCSTRKRNGYKKFIQCFSQMIDLNILHNRIEKRMTRLRKNQTKYISNYLGAWGEKEVHPKSEFGSPKLYQFEDTSFYGPAKPNDYLKRLYGNYLSLPPKEKRVFRHEYYYLNLGLPYEEFIERIKKGQRK